MTEEHEESHTTYLNWLKSPPVAFLICFKPTMSIYTTSNGMSESVGQLDFAKPLDRRKLLEKQETGDEYSKQNNYSRNKMESESQL